MMPDRRLLDTDVIIDYLRGVAEAADYVEQLAGTRCLSSISVAELFSGVREGSERTAIHTFPGAFEVVAIDREIAERRGLYRRQYGPDLVGIVQRPTPSPLTLSGCTSWIVNPRISTRNMARTRFRSDSTAWRVSGRIPARALGLSWPAAPERWPF
jgi:predicted nucleic acid-binding protein